MLLISALFLAVIFGVNGQCSLNEKQKLDNVCSAEVTCRETAENINQILGNWACRKSGQRRWIHRNYEDYYEEVLDNSYFLNLNIKDVDVIQDPFDKLTEVSNNVIEIKIEGGNLIAIPMIIGSLIKLTRLSLIYNQVETINFREVSAGPSLMYLNVSHNYISSIEEDFVESAAPSMIITIDLSFNLLKTIPDNCFARFKQLKYLNLSANFLTQFDILTFEGIGPLESLKLSNNKLSEVGQSFARFRKLKELNLDHNLLTSLTDLNLKSLISLEKLNLSSNLIKVIEDRALTALTELKQLDLSHNRINVIHRVLFENNLNIHTLSLAYNEIEHIEGGAFRSNNISNFDVQNNTLSGSIEYDTFLGISTYNLDLSNGKLRNLGDKAFSSLSSDLMYLNMSNNILDNITITAFESLGNLMILDLSFNNLIDIAFDTSNLKNLTHYYLQNNKIKKVTSTMFKNLTNLIKLDLSQNKIVDIEYNSFIELVNLRELIISDNNLVHSLAAHVFRGLFSLTSLVLADTRLMSCSNESFSGMVSLTYLNISRSQLENIEYNTFKGTGDIEIIDLSYNLLENFHINTSSISKLSELYLSYNKLFNLTSKTFENFHLLEKLSLAFNNIIYIDASALRTLSHLRHLNLNSNINLHIKGDLFNNLFLSEITFSFVHKQIDFKNSYNTSIKSLTLSQCDITDINSVFVHNIKNVLSLDISFNKIKVLDKDTFMNMISLTWLDISSNMISTIQPGTFLTNKMINTLNLYGNNLQYLQFGVLDGLTNLRVLNLSNNEIHTFGVNLLHAAPLLTDLFLENNNLEIINFHELSKTSVSLLTIGGNNIICDTLAEWYKFSNPDLNVTAETLNFNSENLHGIACNTVSSQDKNVNKNYNANITSDVTGINETVSQLSGYIKSMKLNETFTKIIAILGNVSENINHNVAAHSNFTERTTSDLKDLLILDKNLLPHLVNTSDKVENSIKILISLLEINNNLTKLSNTYKDLFDSLVTTKSDQKPENLNSTEVVPRLYGPLEVNLDNSSIYDIKVLLYFIAVCLTVLLLFFVVTLAVKYLYKHSSWRINMNRLSHSGQSFRNGLEME